MQDSARFRLLFGPYETPLFEYGDVVFCKWRGEVKIVGITDAKLAWPIGQKGSNRSLVIYDGLLQALRRESNQSVAHCWGLARQTVSHADAPGGVGNVDWMTSVRRQLVFRFSDN